MTDQADLEGDSQREPCRLAKLIMKRMSAIQVLARFSQRNLVDFKKNSDFMVSPLCNYRQQILTIVQKNRRLRTAKDIDLLQMAFASNPFFRDLIRELGVPILRNILKELQYEHFTKRQQIFKIGEQGKKFYLIMRGQVYVLAKKQTLQGQHVPELAVHSRRESFSNIIGRTLQRKHQERQRAVRQSNESDASNIEVPAEPQSAFLTQFLEDPEYLASISDDYFMHLLYPDQQVVSTLGSGQFFGEIALAQKVARTATIICKSDELHMVSLSQDVFNLNIAAYYNQTMKGNLMFLREVDMFRNWTESMLNQIYYHFEIKAVTFNQTIYKEGDSADEVFIIREGTVEITQLMHIEQRKLSPIEIQITHYISNPEKLNSKTKRIRLALLTALQVFGQDELLMNIRRQTQAICTSDKAVLYVLKKSRFFSYCLKGEQLRDIEQNTVEKEQWRLHNTQICIKREQPQTQEFPSTARNDNSNRLDEVQRMELSGTVPLSIQDNGPSLSMLPQLNSAEERLLSFRKRYTKRQAVPKVSSFYSPAEEKARVNSVTHQSKFHETTEQKKQLQDSVLQYTGEPNIVVEQGKNILMEKRLRDIQEKFRVKVRHYRNLTQDLAKFKKTFEMTRRPEVSVDIVKRSPIHRFEERRNK